MEEGEWDKKNSEGDHQKWKEGERKRGMEEEACACVCVCVCVCVYFKRRWGDDMEDTNNLNCNDSANTEFKYWPQPTNSRVCPPRG